MKTIIVVSTVIFMPDNSIKQTLLSFDSSNEESARAAAKKETLKLYPGARVGGQLSMIP